jgi:hypothetical protein
MKLIIIMSKKCVLVHVLKEQVNGPVNLNKSALCDTDQYVCVDDLIETVDFEEVLIKLLKIK